MTEYHKEYYLKNKEELNKKCRDRYNKLKEDKESYEAHLKSGRDWRKANLEKGMWFQAKKRAIENKLEFNLEVSDIVIPEICPVLGIKLERLEKRHAGSPSLDRIDNTKGYIKCNICVISWRANALKKDATVGELLLISAYMLRKNLNGRKANN